MVRVICERKRISDISNVIEARSMNFWKGTIRMSKLTTLHAVKEYLGIEQFDTSQNADADLLALIRSASEDIEKYCGRTFEIQRHSEIYDGNASDILFLNHTPIHSVCEVKIDSAIEEDFEIRDDYIWLRNGLFTAGQQNVAVNYCAGYFRRGDEPPSDLQDACIQLVTVRRTLPNTYTEGLLPLSVAIILDKYRKPKLAD